MCMIDATKGQIWCDGNVEFFLFKEGRGGGLPSFLVSLQKLYMHNVNRGFEQRLFYHCKYTSLWSRPEEKDKDNHRTTKGQPYGQDPKKKTKTTTEQPNHYTSQSSFDSFITVNIHPYGQDPKKKTKKDTHRTTKPP